MIPFLGQFFPIYAYLKIFFKFYHSILVSHQQPPTSEDFLSLLDTFPITSTPAPESAQNPTSAPRLPDEGTVESHGVAPADESRDNGSKWDVDSILSANTVQGDALLLNSGQGSHEEAPAVSWDLDTVVEVHVGVDSPPISNLSRTVSNVVPITESSENSELWNLNDSLGLPSPPEKSPDHTHVFKMEKVPDLFAPPPNWGNFKIPKKAPKEVSHADDWTELMVNEARDAAIYVLEALLSSMFLPHDQQSFCSDEVAAGISTQVVMSRKRERKPSAKAKAASACKDFFYRFSREEAA